MERVTTEEQRARPRSLRVRWLGRIGYRDAWALQRALAEARAAGRLKQDQLLLLEHDPVITLGRNAREEHVLALPGLLAARGIEVVRVERGGEVTYHGPGQLVVYPIVALAAPAGSAAPAGPSRPSGHAPSDWAPSDAPRPLGVRAFVEALEGAMADACAAAGIVAGPRPGHPGCWVDPDGPLPRKIGALGIRVARGVSFHGIALNVTTDLADFDLIDPCGMPGLRSTSLAVERVRAGLAETTERPSTADVAAAASAFSPALAARLGAGLDGPLPPTADPAAERRALEALVADLAAAPARPLVAATGPA